MTVTKAIDALKIELTWAGDKPFIEKFEKEGGTEFQSMR